MARPARRLLLLGAALAILAGGCTRRLRRAEGAAPPGAERRWRELLERVAHGSLVDYELLERHHRVLLGFLAHVAEHGPRSDHVTESREDRRLSFMLDAYNACALEAVLEERPLERVEDARFGIWRWWPRLGAFLAHQCRVDGEWVSLYHLETLYIVHRYQEPLVHVALHHGHAGDPPLRWWSRRRLQDGLEDAMRAWLATDSALRPEGDGWAASEHLWEWEEDALDWSEARTLCGWLAPYAEGERRAWLEAHADDCPLGRFPLDRRVAEWRGPRGKRRPGRPDGGEAGETAPAAAPATTTP